MALRTERNMLDMNRLRGAKELVKLNIWLNLLLYGCNVKGDTVSDKTAKFLTGKSANELLHSL